jgi:hypothetical protein
VEYFLIIVEYCVNIVEYFLIIVEYALLSPRSDGKPEAATAVVVAPDDGHKDARNVLSCI